MNDKAITAVVAVITGLVGLAVIATLVSSGAKTGNVLGALGSSLSNVLCKAISPVTGGSCGGSIPSVNSTITFGS